jgi:hypothetical protein
LCQFSLPGLRAHLIRSLHHNADPPDSDFIDLGFLLAAHCACFLGQNAASLLQVHLSLVFISLPNDPSRRHPYLCCRSRLRGLGIGLVSILIPMYNISLSAPRGEFVSLSLIYQCVTALGALIFNVSNYATKNPPLSPPLKSLSGCVSHPHYTLVYLGFDPCRWYGLPS